MKPVPAISNIILRQYNLGINLFAMKSTTKNQYLRIIGVLILCGLLSGCIYWIRAYQTYLQMDEFDRYFAVAVTDDFTLQFKKPILYSKDFVSLAKLQPSQKFPAVDGSKRWRYWFRKIDSHKKIITPEIKFYSELSFNNKDRIIAWSFSSLFLQIAPPKFLEVSLRSIGGAEINKEKMQLRAKADLLDKIAADLPKKAAVTTPLGAPLEIIDEKENEVYVYHFLLDSPKIDEGYEDRAISEVKLTFDKSTQELIKMAGRFAGLKISINYRNFVGQSGDDSMEASVNNSEND
jgi:hypothetical protein